MQPINDDMEELFRRAAKDYPLNTDNGNWDELLHKMNSPSEVHTPPARDKRRFLWLLLLLPLFFICSRYTISIEEKGKVATNNTSSPTKRVRWCEPTNSYG
jgi:hypothetical protein